MQPSSPESRQCTACVEALGYCTCVNPHPPTCFRGAEGQPGVVHDHGVDDGAGHVVPRQQPNAGADALLHLLLRGTQVQPEGEPGGTEPRRGGASAGQGVKQARRQQAYRRCVHEPMLAFVHAP